MPQVKAIEVYDDGPRCVGYQFFYQDGFKTELHLGKNRKRTMAPVQKKRFELKEGEYLTEMSGTVNHWFNSLYFKTS